jgi:hypothetical protein
MKNATRKFNLCLFVYFLNETKSIMLTTNKDEEERKKKDNKNEKKIKNIKPHYLKPTAPPSPRPPNPKPRIKTKTNCL